MARRILVPMLPLAAVCLSFAGVTLLWLRLHHAPPSWDEAWYLTNSLLLYDAWTERGVIGFARQLLSALEFKAPLIAALPAPFYLVLGRNWRFGYLVNLAAMPVLFGSIWAIGKRLWNARAGLIAVYIAGTMPLLYGLARWYMVEYTLAAVVAAALWLLLVSENLENGPATAFLGVLCGVGLLLKASFPLYVLAPTLFALWRCKRKLRAVALLAIPCFVLALPWYALHWRATLKYAISGGFGDSAAAYRTGAIAYLTNVIHEGVSDYYAATALVVAVLTAYKRRWETFRSMAPLSLWGIAFVVFLLGANKDIRFLAPILPAFALGAACLLDAAAGRRVWLLVLALVFPSIGMLAVSFGAAPALRYAHVYGAGNWRQPEILDAIRGRLLVRPGEKKRVIVAADRVSFNVHNFDLTALQQKLPLSFETTAYQQDLSVLDSASFVVVKEGGEPESDLFNPQAVKTLPYLRTTTGFEEIPFARPLPDGGLARIFARVLSRAPLPELPAFHADFGGILELTGLVVNRTAGAVEVKRRWRALKPMARDYWTFTHIVDAQDKIVAQIDDRIQNGDVATSNWSPGDEAFENARVKVSRSANLRLRFGVYYPPTGERLIVDGQAGNTALTSTLPAP